MKNALDRRSTAEALGKLKLTEAAPALRPLLNEQDPDVVMAAAMALARMDDKASSYAIRQALGKAPYEETKRELARALAWLGNPDGIPMLIEGLDHRDDLIREHAPDREVRDAILGNELYENITSKFVHSHDYIAMERLHEIHATGRYDLIVVDTPPSRHAIDFLEAPRRMGDFFSSRLLRWLTVPYRSRIVSAASRMAPAAAIRVREAKAPVLRGDAPLSPACTRIAS